MNDRIGTIHPDGSRTYPALTINGHAYARTDCTVIPQPDGRFFVVGVNERYDPDTVRALLAPPVATEIKSKPKREGKHDEGATHDTHADV